MRNYLLGAFFILLLPGTEVLAANSTTKLPEKLSELDLPLILQEVAGVKRQREICSSGVPLPCGLLKEPEGIAVFDPAGQLVPAQFRVLERWRENGLGKGDLSIKWLLVTFLADIPAGKTVVYSLKAGKNPAPAQPVTLSRKGGNYLLNGLELKQDFSAPFKAVLTTPDDRQIPASELPFKWSVWEEGPVRSIIKAESPTVDGKFGLLAYVYAYAGSKRWDLTIVLKNTPNKMRGPICFKDFSVTWAPTEIKGASKFSLGGQWGQAVSGQIKQDPVYLNQASDGTSRWDKFGKTKDGETAFVLKWKYKKIFKEGIPEFRGYRVMAGDKKLEAGNYAQGWGTLATNQDGASAFACVREFRRNYPKVMELDSGKFSIRLWPKQWKGHRGLHWLDDCTRKDHDLSFVITPGEITRGPLASLRLPADSFLRRRLVPPD